MDANSSGENKIADFQTGYKEKPLSKPQEISLTITKERLFGNAFICEQIGTKEQTPVYSKFDCRLDEITKVYVNTDNKNTPIYVQCDNVSKATIIRKRIILPCFSNHAQIVKLIHEAKEGFSAAEVKPAAKSAAPPISPTPPAPPTSPTPPTINEEPKNTAAEAEAKSAKKPNESALSLNDEFELATAGFAPKRAKNPKKNEKTNAGGKKAAAAAPEGVSDMLPVGLEALDAGYNKAVKAEPSLYELLSDEYGTGEVEVEDLDVGYTPSKNNAAELPEPIEDEENPAKYDDLDVQANSEAEEEIQAEVKSEAKAEIKAEAKEEVKAETKAEAKEETKPEVKPKAKEEVKTEVKSEVKSETKAKVDFEEAPPPPKPKLDKKPDKKHQDEKKEMEAKQHEITRNPYISLNQEFEEATADFDVRRAEIRLEIQDKKSVIKGLPDTSELPQIGEVIPSSYANIERSRVELNIELPESGGESVDFDDIVDIDDLLGLSEPGIGGILPKPVDYTGQKKTSAYMDALDVAAEASHIKEIPENVTQKYPADIEGVLPPPPAIIAKQSSEPPAKTHPTGDIEGIDTKKYVKELKEKVRAQSEAEKTKPEVKPDAKPVARVEPKPEPRVEAKPVPKFEAKPEPGVEAKAEPKAEIKREAAPKKAESMTLEEFELTVKKLKVMLDNKVITQSEFSEEKKKLLSLLY